MYKSVGRLWMVCAILKRLEEKKETIIIDKEILNIVNDYTRNDIKNAFSSDFCRNVMS